MSSLDGKPHHVLAALAVAQRTPHSRTRRRPWSFSGSTWPWSSRARWRPTSLLRRGPGRAFGRSASKSLTKMPKVSLAYPEV